MLAPLDYAVIAFYFLFMAGVGWAFRRAGADSSDYFRGGGRMAWWLVGASAFMAAFSAWTFTGAAGLAYRGGFIVFTIYWANALGFLAIALLFGPWFRQTRAVTVIEAIRQRLGATNEQIFVWLGLPIALVRAAIWLYGLAIFLSPVFRMDLTTVIIVCGVVVVVVSALGGSWAVATGDFMQALLLMPITVVAAWLALARVGGVQPLLDGLPPEHFDLTASSLPGFGVLWLVAILIEKLVIQNGLGSAGRFLCVNDSRDARRAAIFASALFLVGSIAWFVPPLAARSLGIDLASRFPALTNPAEAAYAVMAIETLPAGLLGLLVTGLIAATMSSMDVGLNANAGMFVRGFYHPVLRPGASERQLVRAGRATTVVMGAIVVVMAWKYSTWRNVGVFELMMNVSAMLGVPSAVPLFWSLFLRRSPDWAAWSTMLVGFCVSLALGWLPRQEWAHAAVADTAWAERVAWARVNEYAVIMIVNTLVCSLWFWGTTRWQRRRPLARAEEIEQFFAALDRPVMKSEAGAGASGGHGRTIARLCYLYGVFLTAIALFPNTGSGHFGLLFCAVFFFSTGLLIGWFSRRQTDPAAKPSVANQR